LVDQAPNNALVVQHLCQTYLKFNEYSEAATSFEQAAARSKSDDSKVSRLGMAARAYRKAGNITSFQSMLSQARSLALNSEAAERAFLRAQRNLIEDNERFVLAGTLERLLELEPADSANRFTLAYHYDEKLGANALSLYHYLLIPHEERHTSTWNNLGVVQDKLELSAKAVTSYQKAADLGETLAMSNLAYKYLREGFLAEAKAQCDRALATDEPHKNVNAALGQIHDAQESEADKEATIREQTRPSSDFFKALGRATVKSTPTEMPTKLQGPKCVLSVEISNSSFRAIGEYEVTIGAFANLFAPAETPTKIKHRIEYRGEFWGRAVIATMTDKRADKVESLLEAPGKDKPALMIIADDGKTVQVCEMAKGVLGAAYDLTVLSSEAS
jgi:tetratricopeptide (TPR) repeat protein